ncbi:uncharacterized protein PHA67_003718 [Liasis olivaceus]
MRVGAECLLGALVLLEISGDVLGSAAETLGAQPSERPSPCPGRLCCDPRDSPDCCAFRQERPGQCPAMGQLKARPRDRRAKATTRSLPRALPISNASWFYIAVVLTCLLVICICFSYEKYRRWLLGLDERTDESEKEGLSGMTSLKEPPADVRTDPSTCCTVDLQSANRCIWWTCVNNKNPETERNPEMEMTLSPQVPTNPALISEADSLV